MAHDLFYIGTASFFFSNAGFLEKTAIMEYTGGVY